MGAPDPTAPPDTAAVIIECELGCAAIVSYLIAHWESVFGGSRLPKHFSFQYDQNNQEIRIIAESHDWIVNRRVSCLLLRCATAPLDILRAETETLAMQLFSGPQAARPDDTTTPRAVDPLGRTHNGLRG